ncbi:hypothetical protein [Glycomyces xiaoerkulensis]|uniref:hypothetical protein n=1 Tax=Glycomyces xiaoerkulensis TaxID=2038139 RepID=UPI000C2619B9|nr:hypothetical protein [Glycomyces xiaoerkulensis]
MPDRNVTLGNRRYGFGVSLFTEGMRYFAFWIVAAIVLAALAPIVVAQFRSIEISAWYFPAHAGKFFTAVIAGVFLFPMLPVCIAAGLTRRELATAMKVLGLLWSGALGALAVALFLAEHAMYRAFGWTHAIEQGPVDRPFESFGAVLEHSAWLPLTYLLYFVGGALIGVASYRWDLGWLIIVPVVPTVLFLQSAIDRTEVWGPDWFKRATEPAYEWGVAPALIATVAAIVVGAWAARRILLDTPIRAKQA